MILLHDNAPAHKAKPVRDTLEAFNWEVLTHAGYSSDLDYHLFWSMCYALKDQHFKTAEEVEKWVNEWFSSKPQELFGKVSTN